MKGRGGRWLGWVLALVLASGCATELGAGGAAEDGARPDAFQVLQAASGLDPEAWHPPERTLTVARARELLGQVARARVTQRSFAPRRALAWLLTEALEEGEAVPSGELNRRARRFEQVGVVRPDGTWVAALTGEPLHPLGRLELVDGEWRVGRLVVGDFYASRGGVLYPVNAVLRREPGPPWGEVGLGRDWLSAALDGAEDAVGEMARALGQTVQHPVRTAEDLALLPRTVAALLLTSPAYFERYGALPREAQVREAARLSTHVVMLVGGGEVAAGRLGGLGMELSLTARGELVLARSVVGVEAGAAVLGAGALSVVQMAARESGGTPSRAGPGRWVHQTPTTESAQALDYQEQVTGQPAWRVYRVGEVEFDGFTGVELLEAKGGSYKKFLEKDGTAQPWFARGKGLKGVLNQAEAQWKVSQRLGIPLVWHVAEVEFANFLRATFKQRKWNEIDVRHTPPRR
ncbi:Tox-REase-5 domain-containing protein [Melittangium boletus]|uniref:Tox-REase-5 domain-containing protein n=1 Tax=Melittangium boletus TaxID=83453 RepID=UPI003DA37A66